MSAEETATKVAKAVADGKASEIVKFLFGILPKSAHGKIVDIEVWYDAKIEALYDADCPVGQCVSVSPLDKRAVADTVQAYGLELDLDSAGLAVRITTPYEFVA